MKTTVGTGERGFVKLILLIVVALLVVSYFGINLRSLAEQPTTKDNFSYVASTTVTIWDDYLKTPVTYLWNDVFLSLIWQPAMHNLMEARNGQTLDIASSTPIVPLPSRVN